MFDFRRATVFSVGYRLSKHKMTTYSKNLGSWPLGSFGYAYAVTADNGKTRCFILCEKKHEWICSSASTS